MILGCVGSLRERERERERERRCERVLERRRECEGNNKNIYIEE